MSWAALPCPRHELAEEPTLADGRVLYVDVPRGEIWSHDLNGPPELLHRIEAPISAARPFRDGLVVASRMDVLLLGPDGCRPIAAVPRDPQRWQVNGLIVLPDGSLLLGLLSRDRSEAGELLHIAEGHVTTVVAGVRAANGLCLDPDRGTIWHVDTYARTLTRFATDRLRDGVVVSKFDGVPGRPDGACVAANGDVWVAMWDGGLLVRLDETGAIRDTVAVPVSRPTCPLQVAQHLLTTTARSPGDNALDGKVLVTSLE